MRLAEIELQLEIEITKFLISELGKNINIDITKLKYGNYVIYIHYDQDNNATKIHATIGFGSSIIISVKEKKIIEYKYLKYFNRKKTIETYTKLGELINENLINRIIDNEKEQIDIILDNVKNKENFKEKTINNIRKNKLKNAI